MATTYSIIYKGRDNTISIQLASTDENGVVTHPDLVTSSVSTVELLIKGVFYSSDNYADAFDFTTEGAEGIITMKLGIIEELAVTKDSLAEIITYDPSHVEGLVWGTIPIRIIELVGTEAAPETP